MALPWKRAYTLFQNEGAQILVKKGSRYIYLEVLHNWEHTVRQTLGNKLYFRYKIWKNTGRNRHSALADPFTIIEIDPDEITHCSPHHSRLRWAYTGKIKDGDWDKGTEQYVDRYSHIHRMLYRHFNEGISWDETDFIDDCKNKGRMWHGTSKSNEIDAHCRRLDAIYRDIKTHGYKSKTELSELDIDRAFEVERGVEDLFDEITVDIARDGELLFVDGKHRLSIAKILSLDSIPVRVCVRHEQWQEIRDEVAACDRVDELSSRARSHLDHPDLADLRRSLDTESVHESTD